MFSWSFRLWGQIKRCSTPGSLVRESIATPGLQYKLCKPKWQHGFVQLATTRHSEVCEQWIQLLWLRCATGFIMFLENELPTYTHDCTIISIFFSSFPQKDHAPEVVIWRWQNYASMAVTETLSMQSVSVKQGNVLSKLNEFHDSAMLSVEGQKRMDRKGWYEELLVAPSCGFPFEFHSQRIGCDLVECRETWNPNVSFAFLYGCVSWIDPATPNMELYDPAVWNPWPPFLRSFPWSPIVNLSTSLGQPSWAISVVASLESV